MLAKVDFDGKEHIAIVLNSRMGFKLGVGVKKKFSWLYGNRFLF